METKETLLKLILIENKVKSYILRRLEENGQQTGLSLEDKMLVFMFFKKEPVKPREIIYEFHFKKSNLAASCTKLCAANLIQKTKDIMDAREVLFTLTKKGEEKVLSLINSLKTDLKKDETAKLDECLTTLAEFVDK